MTRFGPGLITWLLLGVTSVAGLAHAAPARPIAAAALLHLAGGGISLDQAVQMAQARYRARVVRAETTRQGDHVYYRLRLLSADGRVFSVLIDAQTGSFQ